MFPLCPPTPVWRRTANRRRVEELSPTQAAAATGSPPGPIRPQTVPMSPGSPVTRARRLWQVVEPVHTIVYFAEEPVNAAEQLGLKGFWMGYFAGRAAPMGAVGAPVVAATFYGFKPWMPERALPDAWRLADPATVLATWNPDFVIRATASVRRTRRLLSVRW